MAPNKLKKPIMWLIRVASKRNLLEKDRDFIAELVSEEARKTKTSYGFILHDIIESKKCSELIIEGTKNAIDSLLTVTKDNLPCKVSYRIL